MFDPKTASTKCSPSSPIPKKGFTFTLIDKLKNNGMTNFLPFPGGLTIKGKTQYQLNSWVTWWSGQWDNYWPQYDYYATAYSWLGGSYENIGPQDQTQGNPVRCVRQH